MTEEFIVGIDSSTQSTKAIAWTRDGAALGEGRAAVPMSTPAEGRFEQDPRDWWGATKTALADLGKSVDLGSCAGIGISNQRETVAFVDDGGQPVAPGIVWLDQRAIDDVSQLTDRFGEAEMHRITGKPKDVTPVVFRLEWMRKNMPDALARAHVVDVHSHLAWHLTGTRGASWTSADPFGTFDIQDKTWSGSILDAVNVKPGQMAKLYRPGAEIGQVSEMTSEESGLPMNTPVIAAGGDGQCAGLGVNATREGTAYLNLGTAIITGAWSANPQIGFGWRTMTSPTGDGYFLEGVLRAGTFFVDWFIKSFVDKSPNAETFARLEAAAEQIPIGSDGLTISPYLSGCMNPFWNMNARAAFLGLAPEHGAGHLYRAVLEALTCEIARTIHDMTEKGVRIDRIIAVGGGAGSTLWRKMIADASGLPLAVSGSLEASSLGAAITAAKGIGWYADFDAAADAMCRTGAQENPDPSTRAQWDAVLARQDHANRLICGDFHNA